MINVRRQESCSCEVNLHLRNSINIRGRKYCTIKARDQTPSRSRSDRIRVGGPTLGKTFFSKTAQCFPSASFVEEGV